MADRYRKSVCEMTLPLKLNHCDFLASETIRKDAEIQQAIS